MLLSVVPLAQPYNVFCGGRDFANRTELGFAIFLEMDGCLCPRPQVWSVLTWYGADHLSVCVPVEASHKMLVVLFAC